MTLCSAILHHLQCVPSNTGRPVAQDQTVYRRFLPVVEHSQWVFHTTSALHQDKCRSAPDKVKRRDGDKQDEQEVLNPVTSLMQVGECWFNVSWRPRKRVRWMRCCW
jgi:hypothetical protein